LSLYKTGVGFFEHRGRVTGNDDLIIRFTSGQLDDVLKSLTALDLGNGRISNISYNSAKSLDRRISGLRLPVGGKATLADMLDALRGARVTLSSGATSVTGRLLSVEHQSRTADAGAAVDVVVVAMLSDAGELRSHDVDSSLRIRVADGDLRQEIGQYLDLVGAARDLDERRMVIRTAGAGEREIYVSYVSEVPVWKTTYRLVLTDTAPPLLQGWAIVDNTIGEDWTNVQLSLVAGRPQTFIQQVSQPYYTRRPVIPLPRTALRAPQTHEGTLQTGPGTLAGTVRDASGATLAGVTVILNDGSRRTSAVTDARGTYRLATPAGVYQVTFQLAGFSSASMDNVVIGGGITRQQDAVLSVGALEESVTIVGASPGRNAVAGATGRGGGFVGGVVGGLEAAPPPPPLRSAGDVARALQPAAAAADLGDLFEYRITDPVTIAKNQSALVPILSSEVKVERVSLWSRASGSGRPLGAVWLTNTSYLTLDGGTFSVVEGEGFAGEGLIDPLAPGERRLLSYATDLGVLVSVERSPAAHGIAHLRAAGGVLIEENEERTATVYRIRNEDTSPRVVVVEHPATGGWQLAGGPEPAERSTDAYRFRVPAKAKEELALEVPERRTTFSRIAIGEIDESQLETWSHAGLSAADLAAVLGPVIDKRRELAEYDEQIKRLDEERQAIFTDQARLRDNLKSLGRSSEERRLIERYTRQLDEGENRLTALRDETTRVSSARDRARDELAQAIARTSFDIGAP
jgi:hypothetical protein